MSGKATLNASVWNNKAVIGITSRYKNNFRKNNPTSFQLIDFILWDKKFDKWDNEIVKCTHKSSADYYANGGVSEI